MTLRDDFFGPCRAMVGTTLATRMKYFKAENASRRSSCSHLMALGGLTPQQPSSQHDEQSQCNNSTTHHSLPPSSSACCEYQSLLSTVDRVSHGDAVYLRALTALHLAHYQSHRALALLSASVSTQYIDCISWHHVTHNAFFDSFSNAFFVLCVC